MTVGISKELREIELVIEPVIEPVVELVFDRDCPHVALCREALRAAFDEAELPPAWSEWERNALDTPPALRHYGSPTILVNGHDIAAAPGGATPSGNSCRVYANDERGGLSGAPSVRSIVSALLAQAGAQSPHRVAQRVTDRE